MCMNEGNALGTEKRQRHQALKGRDRRFHGARASVALSGLVRHNRFSVPRALPWGLICCGPFGAVFGNVLGSEHRRLAAKGRLRKSCY